MPRHLLQIGDQQEDRFGRLGREYGKVVFDKTLLGTDPKLEWVTPGHPLFETVRTDVVSRTEDSLRRGAVFFDLHRTVPSLIDVFAASIKDGRGQSPQRRVDRSSWNQQAHEEWARRCDVVPAPAWTHPNGGLYLYGTDAFGLMFPEIISNLLPTGGKHDLGCDECLIVNQLWTYHRSAICFLPADYNVNLHQNDCWVSNPVMQSYIYHFVARAKERLPEVRWQRTDPLELPYPWDKRSRAIVDNWGNRPPDSFSLENITQVETAANLLTAYPNLQITVACSQDSQLGSCDAIPNHDRCGQSAATHTSYLNLIRLLLRLGPNASRIVPNENSLAMLSQQLGVKGNLPNVSSPWRNSWQRSTCHVKETEENRLSQGSRRAT